MATYRVQPPDLEECKSFDVYMTKLTVWEATTPAEVEKRGALIAASLPNKSVKYKKDLQDKFFEQVDGTKLVTKEGLALVKAFLKKELGEEDLYKSVRVWNELEDCKQKSGEIIEDFLSRFERCYTMVTANSTTANIPAENRAFMVLKRASVSDTQRMLILSKMNLDDKSGMFEAMCKELKLVLGGGPGQSGTSKSSDAITVEPIKNDEDVFLTFNGNRYYRDGGRGRGRGSGGQGHGEGRGRPYDRPHQPRENRKDDRGQVTRCRFCESKFHYQKNCGEYNKFPKDGGARREGAYVMEEIDFAFATQLKDELGQFTREARNCAALDTCCTSSVAGRPWFDMYVQELGEEERRKVRGPELSNRLFKFGNNGMLRSLGHYSVPAMVAGKSCVIDFDLIDSDIPLLMSKKAMKKMKMRIDLEKDTACIWGTTVELKTTNSGHYLLSLLGDAEEVNIAWVLAINLEILSEKEKLKQMKKLHKQFGHTPKAKFVTFMKDANVWHESLEKHLDMIISECRGCLILKRRPDKPVVSMPMASTFNEKVAIDLKEVREGDKKFYILHMVDMWSRLTQSVIIERKEPREVIDKFMIKWIGVFGCPRAILNDNGGEFTAEEIREFKSILNITDLTTGAESPWQNGLCEKNHQVVDTMWARLKEDYPDVADDVLLGWATMAKNSMAMVYGYSSNQLVFGCNPNLPNIVNGGLPSLEGTTFSETLATHLNVLHDARKAFIETENSERIRKALSRKICTNNTVYENGDIVWYRRRNRWMGPGKVVFQDGKVIFVRHGSVLVRVSANRIVRKGEEYATGDKEGEDEVANQDKHDDKATKKTKPFIEVEETEGGANEVEEREVETNTHAGIELDIDPVNLEEAEEDPAENNNDEQAEDNESEDSEEENEETVVEENGKRKRNVEDRPVEKIVGMEGSRNEVLPVKKIIHPPNSLEKMKLKKGDLIEFESDGQVTRARVLNREKASGRFYNYFNVELDDGSKKNIDGERVKLRKLDEEECNMVLIPADRHRDQDCLEAKEVELNKLKEFDTYEEVADMGQHRLSCRWVLWYKGEEVRARLTARGFEELEKVASDSPTIDKCNLRILLAICASKGWSLEASDVKSAFLQGDKLDREVNIQPPKEAGVLRGKLWKLKVALYGLNDASLQFFTKSKKVLLGLGCIQSSMDPALFYKMDQKGELVGMICAHVDDFMHCGGDEFKHTVVGELFKTFVMGKTETREFRYIGFDIKQDEDGITVDQSSFAAGLEIFDVKPERAKQTNDELVPEEKSRLRAVAGKIGWLGRGTRPDLLFSQVEMSTKFVNGKVPDLNQAAKVIRKVKDSESYFVIKNIGDVKDWCVEVSTDASLCNLNEGVSSTAAKVILLVNKVTGLCAPVSWQCNKISRVVDSTLAAECLSLKDGLNEAIYVRQVIEELLGLKAQSIPVHGIVDNKGTVDAVHSTTNVTDKKLRRDVAGIKQMMSEGEVRKVTWCPGKEQLADCMTKRGAASWDLMEVFRTGRRYEV